MNQVTNLLILYVSVLFLNIVISALLWINTRSQLYRYVLFLWVSSILSFLLQALLVENYLFVVIGFSSSWFINISLVYLLSHLTKTKMPYNHFIGLLLLSYPLAMLAYYRGGNFTLIALPVAIAVAFPGFFGSLKVYAKKRATLNITEKGLLFSMVVLALHNLDYSFLRLKDEFTSPGFAVALIIIFCLSIFAPAAVIEKIKERESSLEQANKLKSEFLANITHELRTPLTLIKVPLEGMIEGSIERTEENLTSLLNNTNILLGQVTNLLDLSRIDAGKHILNLGFHSVNRVIKELLDGMAAAAQVKNIRITDNLTGDVYCHIDRQYFQQAIYNILSNAYKFTPSGGGISVELMESKNAIVISISDSGIGIAPGDHEKIFEKFKQLDNGVNRKSEGTGIGLAFSREIVESHGGRISVESREGEGAHFKIYLPKEDNPDMIGHEEQPDSPIPFVFPVENQNWMNDSSDGKGGSQILIVEDNNELLSLLCSLLSPLYSIITASNGREAFDILDGDMVFPDLILSDIMMPEQDGLSFIKKLSANEEFDDVPVIFLTAKSDLETKLEGLDLGAVDYIVKPFHPGELKGRIASQLKMKHLRNTLKQANKKLYAELERQFDIHERARQGKGEQNGSLNEATEDQKKKISAVVSFLQDNYMYSINRDDTARACGMSPDYLSRLFSLAMKCHFQDFLNRLRLEHAEREIRTKDLNICTIAYDSGFNNLRTFNRQFRNQYKCTPQEYREKS